MSIASPRTIAQKLAIDAVEVRDVAKYLAGVMVKLETPKSVMIVSRAVEMNFAIFIQRLAIYLMDTTRDCLVDNQGLIVYVDSKLKDNSNFNYKSLCVNPKYSRNLKFWDRNFCSADADLVDFIITLGGDGTILYTAWLFQHSPTPPIFPFHLGSLGFLTAFNISDITKTLDQTVGCGDAKVRLNLRMRLNCTVWRPREQVNFSHKLKTNSEPNFCAKHNVPCETFQILNDMVVDRGPSSYMSQLELYVDGKHLTTSQADGLVIATPTGSTAYSLAAGGSLVHPDVNSFLMTPICAHSLSFRPMLLPDSVELQIHVPHDSRNTAWASFDGRHRIELRQGDYISITLSRFPVPCICKEDQSSDWFESLRRSLHWNERTRQKPFQSPAFKTLDIQENMSLENLASILFPT